MEKRDKLLEVNQLSITINTGREQVYPVRNLSFSMNQGERVAIIGESGSGKSQTAMSLLQLNRQANFIFEGRITYKDTKNILELSDKQLNQIRGQEIAYIDQEPMEALNPSLKVGYQIKEVLKEHTDLKRKALKEKTLSFLEKVGIKDARRVYKSYPHQLSGGMQQRVLIAMALIAEPSLVIADEPTTALDVALERRILALLLEMQKAMDLSVIIISHDISVVESFADKIMVMYGGEIVEIYDCKGNKPKHPYTKALKACMPSIEKEQKKLKIIEGEVFDLTTKTDGCHFYERCLVRMEQCKKDHPEIRFAEENHGVRCFLYE